MQRMIQYGWNEGYNTYTVYKATPMNQWIKQYWWAECIDECKQGNSETSETV